MWVYMLSTAVGPRMRAIQDSAVNVDEETGQEWLDAGNARMATNPEIMRARRLANIAEDEETAEADMVQAEAATTPRPRQRGRPRRRATEDERLNEALSDEDDME